jgi:hypothetical protein
MLSSGWALFKVCMHTHSGLAYKKDVGSWVSSIVAHND